MIMAIVIFFICLMVAIIAIQYWELQDREHQLTLLKDFLDKRLDESGKPMAIDKDKLHGGVGECLEPYKVPQGHYKGAAQVVDELYQPGNRLNNGG